MTVEEIIDQLVLQAWTAHPGGLLDHVNPFTCEYLGRTRDELIADNWQNVVHPADLPLAIERWTHAVTTGEPYETDFRLLRASDRMYRWHRATARRMDTPDGPRWVGSNVDVDAARRADEVRQAWQSQELDSLAVDRRAT